MATDVTTQKGPWLTGFGIPDQRLELWEAESMYTAEDPIPSVAEPQGAETLQVQASGTPTATDTIELRTVRGGYTDGGAGFEYREQADPAVSWIKRRYSWEMSSSELVAEHVSGGTIDAIATATLPDGRAVVAYLVPDQSFFVRCAVEQSDGSFAAFFAGFAPVQTGYVDQSDACGVDVVTWPDGSIDIYTWSDVLRRYRSTDDGATWDEIAVQHEVDSTDWQWSTPGVFGAGSDRRIAVAYSGGRMLLVEDRESLQYASEDGGYTWEYVGATAVDISGTRITLYPIPDGFLLGSDGAIYLVRSPYVASWELLTGGPGGERVSFAFADGYYWAASHRDGGTVRASMSVRRSRDGLTWEGLGIDDHHLSTTALLDGLLVAGRGRMLLMNTLPGAFEVWAHELGGWSSLGGSDAARQWWVAYTPHRGIFPATVADTEEGVTRGTMSVPSVGGSASAAGGVLTLQAEGFDDGVYYRWSPSVGDPDWTVEVDLEVTEGSAGAGVVILVDSNDFIGQALVDASGVQMSSGGADEGSKLLITGRFTIRLQLVQEADDSSAALRAWYRPHGDLRWSEVTSVIDMDSPGTTSIRTELQAISNATSDVTASVYGWRLRNEADPHVDVPGIWSATPQYLQDGISVRSIHGATHPGDEWEIPMGATYHPSNLLPSRPSPRIGYRAAATGDQVLAFRVPNGETASAHVLLLEDLRAWAMRVEVMIDDAWDIYAGTVPLTLGTFDMEELGGNHIRVGDSTASSDLIEYVEAGSLVGAIVTSAAGAHEVLGNTAGLLVDAGQSSAGQRVTLELDSAPTTGIMRLHYPRAAFVLHHEPGTVVQGIRITLYPVGTDYVIRAGNAVIAPITWLPAGPDHTATTGLDIMGTIGDEEDGTEHVTRTRPDRRRVELNFARLLPMYAQDAGDFDFFLAGSGTDPAATTWTLPQVLTGIARTAGRRPVVYLPAVPMEDTTAGSVQQLSYTAACQVIHGRLAMASVRHEGVLGHHGTADQVVRDSTWTITEVV